MQGELLPHVVKKQMSVFLPSQPPEESSMASPSGDLKMDKKKGDVSFILKLLLTLSVTNNLPLKRKRDGYSLTPHLSKFKTVHPSADRPS